MPPCGSTAVEQLGAAPFSRPSNAHACVQDELLSLLDEGAALGQDGASAAAAAWCAGWVKQQATVLCWSSSRHRT